MKSRSKPAKPKAKRAADKTDLTQSRPAKKQYPPERLAGLKPWQPGESGNPSGRPLGARSKLNEAFLEALGEAWAKHGVACLEWLAANDKALFVQLVASLIPRNVNAKLDIARSGVAPIITLSGRPEALEAKSKLQFEGSIQ